MVTTSIITIIALAILCLTTEDDLIIFERFYAVYVEAVSKSIANDPKLVIYEKIFAGESESEAVPGFPPDAWIVLEMMKAVGAFFGLVTAKVILSSALWLVFDFRIQQQPVEEILEDEEDEVTHSSILFKTS